MQQPVVRRRRGNDRTCSFSTDHWQKECIEEDGSDCLGREMCWKSILSNFNVLSPRHAGV